MNKLRFVCFVVCVFVCFAAVAASRFYTADFVSDAVPAGWAAGESVYSRSLSNEVLSVEIWSDGEEVSVHAGTNVAAATEIGRVFAPSTNAVFRLPQTANCRFVTVSSAHARRCVLETVDTRIASPTNLVLSDVTESSFALSWDAVADAHGYCVQVSTNALMDHSEGSILWRETFAGIETNATYSSSKGFDIEAFRARVDTKDTAWDGNLLFPYDHGNGVVRVGNSSNPGWLSTPPSQVTSENVTLHFRAWRVDAGATATNRASKPACYDVAHVSGTITNRRTSVCLTTAPSNVAVALPNWKSGDRVVFHSSTNKSACRLAIDEISLRTGYAEGTWTPVVCDSKVVTDTSVVFDNLPTTAVSVSVTARAATEVDDSPAATYTLDLAHPPPSVALTACPLDGTPYTQTFDCLTNITKKLDWRNCRTVPYWQAWLDYGEGDVEAVSEINQNAGKITTSGLYAWHDAAATVSSYALGSLASGDHGFVFGLAFQNAQEVALTSISVTFTAKQLNFRSGVKTIPFEYLVTNELVSVAAPGDWKAVDTAAFTTVASNPADTDSTMPRAKTKTAAVSDAVPMGGYLLIRWTDCKEKSSCPFAVDDVSVSYESALRPTVLLLR